MTAAAISDTFSSTGEMAGTAKRCQVLRIPPASEAMEMQQLLRDGLVPAEVADGYAKAAGRQAWTTHYPPTICAVELGPPIPTHPLVGRAHTHPLSMGMGGYWVGTGYGYPVQDSDSQFTIHEVQ